MIKVKTGTSYLAESCESRSEISLTLFISAFTQKRSPCAPKHYQTYCRLYDNLNTLPENTTEFRDWEY
jgi:hypothetical protein